jgi:aspartate racemase
MKIIGLLGGMSWESSVEYYRLINEDVRDRLGGLHSAECLLRSLDFDRIETLQREDRWDEAGTLLASEAESIVRGGAEVVLLCTNTMHKVASEIVAAISVPFVHIADPVGETIRDHGWTLAGLLGTRYTMGDGFYAKRLRERHGIEVIVPEEPDRSMIDSVIYGELCLGQIREESRAHYLAAIDRLAARGAQCVIFGCTEISLLLREDAAAIPAVDATRLHARKAVDLALLA